MVRLARRCRWEAWLDPQAVGPGEARRLLAPAPAGTLVAVPVGQAVNDVRNEGPELVAEQKVG
jgi:putative SOS response-associated peptidase YedK